MASNARNLSKLLGTSTQVPTTALPPAIADLETVGQTLSGGEIAPSSIKSNTLTQSFDSNQAITFNMADSIDAVSPIVSVFKEVPQQGFSSKGQWDVNANATNYDFYDEKPISYSSATLTPSATGNGTFTNSAAITSGYDLSNISYDNKSFDVSSQETKPAGLHFKPDGSKMYVSGYGTDAVYQYSLSTAYDVSTASYDSKSLSGLSQDNANGRGLDFKPDGTKLYFAGSSNGRVYEYSLSTAWDVSTGSYNNVFFNVGSQSNNASGVRFKSDGTKMYVTQYQGNSVGNYVYQYSLSTAWDITTASYDNVYLDVNTQPAALEDLAFSSDGTSLVVCDAAGVLRKYTLSTAWDISTASLITTTAALTQLSNGSGAVAFNSDGTKTYVASRESDTVCQYSTSASLAFNAADVGKKVVGNSGSAIITATSGTYNSVTAFADTSAISSWQLFGAQGKADGSGIELSGYSVASDIVFPTGASGSGASMVYNNNVSPTSSSFNNLRNVVFNPTGTIALVMTSGNIQRWNLSTAFDLSTMTEASGDNFSGQLTTNQYGLAVSPDGTKLFVGDHGNDLIKQFTLSTPWSPSTQSYNGYYYLNNGGNWNSFTGADGVPSTSNFNPFSFQFNSDGTKMITLMWDNAPYHSVVEFALSTGFDMSTMSYTSFANFDGNVDPEAIVISPDGLKIMMHGYNLGNTGTEVYSLPSAFSVGSSGNSLTKTSGTIDLSSLTGQNTAINYGGLQMSSDGKRMWAIYSGDNKFYEITGGTTSVHPYSTYSPALTNSSTGQINSSSWLDINSMTADETKNSGDIFYAVSTDSRTSWGVAKGSDGVRKIARNNSGTWQYNNHAGSTSTYDLASAAYDSKSADVSGTHSSELSGVAFKTDGTKMYVVGNTSDTVNQYSLSTAWDVSTATYDNVSFNVSSQDGYPSDIFFKPDGTKMFVIGVDSDEINTYTLSTAWDLSTASYTSVYAMWTPTNGGVDFPDGVFFKPDGTKMYIATTSPVDKVFEFALSTAWDPTSASITYGTDFLDVSSQEPTLMTLVISDDGTKLYIIGTGNDTIYQYNLSTAWDISSGSYSNISFSVSSQASAPRGMALKSDGTKIYVTDGSTDRVYQYSIGGSQYGTSETWVNGTNNNEHATLQEALGAQAFNRMNKAQLDAIADAYHFSQDSADTLDLMIAPYAASGTSPVSDGVTINYDAEALIREAIPGTDYIAEFPNPNRLNITAVGAANLKIRAQ